ncbi:PQQ-dependent sugar dehydrogenase [Halobacteria archaeon AArc-dxtr1]|nr:PQQ-dependent sugar dehydrogenase [Halobacteria archaeon AArc-dxtr1]
MSERDISEIRRRTMLQGAAAGTAVAALGVPTAVAQDDDENDVDDDDEDVDDNGAIFGEGPTVALETIADGLDQPTDLQVPEGDDRLFIVDQTGQIHIHDENDVDDDDEEDEDVDDNDVEDDENDNDVEDDENGADENDNDADENDENDVDDNDNNIFLDTPEDMVDLDDDFDERGLLGLAFHPEFEENGQIFVRYSAEGDEPEYGAPGTEVPEEVDHLDRLSRFETTDDDNTEVDPDSEEIILEIAQPQFNHNAGPIRFGPDDYLYVTTGDGGGAGDADEGHVEDWYDEIEGGNGQDTEHNLLGGILRIDVDDDGDDERNYGIPDDNPLVDYEDEGQLPEYWAWGLRNPWRMSFEDGELLTGDVGQALFEIVNHVEAGGNYAWNPWEGTHCFDPDTPEEPPEDCPDSVDDDVTEPRGGEPLLGPVLEYPQEADMGRYADEYDEAGTIGDDRDRIGTAIIGGYMYEGSEVEDLEDTYIFGDWSWDGGEGGRLFIAHPDEEWMDHENDDEDENDADENDNDVENNDDNDVDNADNDENDVDDEDENDDENGVGDEDLERYHPPDEVDLWEMEELTVESDDEELADDGMMQQFVNAFGRDDDGEVYVLTSDSSTIEGEGYVSRIVPADEHDDDDEEDVDDNDVDDDDEENGADDDNGADDNNDE